MKTLANPIVQEDGTLDQDSKRKYTQLMAKFRTPEGLTPEEKEFLGKCVNLMNQGNLSASMVSQEEAEKIYKQARNADGLLDPSKLPPKKLNRDLKLTAGGSSNITLKDINENIKSIQPESLQMTSVEGEEAITKEVIGQETVMKETEDPNKEMIEKAQVAVREYLDERVDAVPGLRAKIDSAKSAGSKVEVRIIDGESLFVYEIMSRLKHRNFLLEMAQADADTDVELETLKTFCLFPDFTNMSESELRVLPAGDTPSLVQVINVASGFNAEISIAFEF